MNNINSQAEIHCFKYNGDGTFLHTKHTAQKTLQNNFGNYLLPNGITVNYTDLGKFQNNIMYSLEYDIVDFLYSVIQQESDKLKNKNSLSNEEIVNCFNNIDKLTNAYLNNNIT